MKVVTTENEKQELEKMFELFKLDNMIAEAKWFAGWLEELKAYRATGYTPEQIAELHDKHWMECMQIVQYSNTPTDHPD